MSDATRRSFLKSSAVAAGAGLVTLPSISAGAYAAADDTIKVGLIGCGGRGTGAASQALSTPGKTKLIAVADAFEDNLQSKLTILQRKFSETPGKVEVPKERQFVGFDAYKKLIELKDLDLVVIATPPGFRPIHFEHAVNQGKHVFAEKPVATDAPGVRRFLKAVEVAKKKNLKVGIGLQRHHQKKYVDTVKRIKDGEIGDVVALRVYWNGGGVWTRPRKAGQTEMEYQMRNWYYFNWLCGDHIVEQHIHNLDVGNWIKSEMAGKLVHPVKANGMGGRQVRTGKEHGEIFDHHAVQYEYEDGTYMFSQCRHIRGCWNSVTEHAHGSKGYANVSGGRIEAGGKKWRFRAKAKNPYQKEHDDLFAAIRDDEKYNEGEYGATSTMIAIMGRMATYSGDTITWDKALNKGRNIMPKNFAFDADPPVKPNADGYYPVPVPGVTNVFES